MNAERLISLSMFGSPGMPPEAAAGSGSMSKTRDRSLSNYLVEDHDILSSQEEISDGATVSQSNNVHMTTSTNLTIGDALRLCAKQSSSSQPSNRFTNKAVSFPHFLLRQKRHSTCHKLSAVHSNRARIHCTSHPASKRTHAAPVL